MKFEYTKADIEAVARDNNYTINVEKILRLSFILNDLKSRLFQWLM